MLDVFWIQGVSPLGLAIVLRPRGGDWLEDELTRIQSAGIDALASLLETEEALELGLEREKSVALALGLTFLSFPIQDRHVPAQLAKFRGFVEGIAAMLKSGQRVGVHCRGSIGRASITAACALIHLGWNARDALTAIESARGCPIPDTSEQREWILRYEAKR